MTETPLELPPAEARESVAMFARMPAPSIADYTLDGPRAFILARMRHARAPYAAQVYARYEVDLAGRQVRLKSVNRAGDCVTYKGGWIPFGSDTGRAFLKTLWGATIAIRRARLHALAKAALRLANE